MHVCKLQIFSTNVGNTHMFASLEINILKLSFTVKIGNMKTSTMHLDGEITKNKVSRFNDLLHFSRIYSLSPYIFIEINLNLTLYSNPAEIRFSVQSWGAYCVMYFYCGLIRCYLQKTQGLF